MQVTDLQYAYDGDPVLSGATLEIRHGETLAVMGANGSGKTTFLRLLAGLREPDGGRIGVDGPVGFAPEDPRAALFAKTVEAEVAFFPENRGLGPESAERAMRTMEITELSDRNPLSLSFGEQRRVSIAAVLAGEPSVAALDEPTAGLGVPTRRRLGERLTELPTTVVFSTHAADFAYEYADRVAVLDDGRFEAIGPARELLTRVELLEAAGIRPPGIVAWALERGLDEPPSSLAEAVEQLGGGS